MLGVVVFLQCLLLGMMRCSTDRSDGFLLIHSVTVNLGVVDYTLILWSLFEIIMIKIIQTTLYLSDPKRIHIL